MMSKLYVQAVLIVGLSLLLAAATPPPAAAAEAGSFKELLELTGGRRVKAAWNQGEESDKDKKLYLLDTKDGEIREIPFCGSAPLLTQDGRYVLASVGKAPDRQVMMYDTETKKVTTLASGPSNNLMAVWQDPKTKRNWAIVNDCGDRNEAWNVPANKVYRFPFDNPQARELFWGRTSSHIFLMLSADGTRACFEPNWSNIGQLKLVYDDQGKVDQEKSTYQQFMGGCFPSMAPDNSYRIFSLVGDHRAVSLCDADNKNPRKVVVTGMLSEAQKGRNTWLTRWSTDPRFLTLVAPAGKDAKIWMGRFDEKFTQVEAWVRVSPEKAPQAWQSHAWIEPKE